MLRNLFTCLALCCIAALAPAQNFVNGNFELGLFDWGTAGSSYGVDRYSTTNFQDANGGNLFIVFGGQGMLTGTLSQSVSDTSGQDYTLSLDIGTLDQSGNNIDISWNGVTLYNGLATYSATDTLTTMNFDVSGTGSDYFSITGYDTSSNLIGFDNANLTPVSATPEPATIPIAVVGLIWAIARRRR
jgi:hypothetical protein